MVNELQSSRRWVRGLFVVGLLLLAFSISLFLSPSSLSERARFLGRITVWLLGPKGPALIPAVAAFLCFYAGRFIWRHTPKRPTDRLWF